MFKKVIFVMLLTISFIFGQDQAASAAKTLSSTAGQYVLGQISMARADQYLLDTKSGRLWQLAVDSSNCMVLQPVLFVVGYSATEQRVIRSILPH